MTVTSTSLLERLRDREDGRAWTRLTHLYAPLIRTWLGRQLPQSADVDDLAQQVFTVVVEKYPDFQHRQPEQEPSSSSRGGDHVPGPEASGNNSVVVARPVLIPAFESVGDLTKPKCS